MLKEASGEDISTRAMMEYFKPLMSWLEEQNKGRQIGCEREAKAVLSQLGISDERLTGSAGNRESHCSRQYSIR